METCGVCLTEPAKKALAKCPHKLCPACYSRCLELKPVCPFCGAISGTITGNQPPGTMEVSYKSFPLSGHESCQTISIEYKIPRGIQTNAHPHPGVRYVGARRQAYIPNNTEGQVVVKMLQLAFQRGLIFTVGWSRTRGQDNKTIWNDIHHKTQMNGGPTNYGYPDPDYLSRVTRELAAKGITEDCVYGQEIKSIIRY